MLIVHDRLPICSCIQTLPEEQLRRDWLYQPNPGYYDEIVAPEGTMRTHWQPLMEPLEQMGHAWFVRRSQEGRRVIHEHAPRSGCHRRQTGVLTAPRASAKKFEVI